MFGLGPTEIVTIIVVALILINPKKLPQILKKAGEIYGKLMKEINGLRKMYGQFENEVKSLSDLTENKDFREGDKK